MRTWLWSGTGHARDQLAGNPSITSIFAIRSHFGSRTISVQVNIVAVSDHVFHRSFVGFLFFVSAHFCFGLMSLSRAVDASGTPVLTHPCSSLFRILVLFMALAPTLMVWCSRSGSTTDEKLDAFLSKFAHFETSSCCHDLDVPCGFTYHENTWILRPDLQRWNRTSAPSLHVCARSRHMQPQHQMLPVRKDLGLHSNKLTAPQPQGPHGPGSSDDNRNTRRRLDISSLLADEHARSAVLLPFPSEQYHKGITKWITNLWEESNMPADNKLL